MYACVEDSTIVVYGLEPKDLRHLVTWYVQASAPSAKWSALQVNCPSSAVVVEDDGTNPPRVSQWTYVAERALQQRYDALSLVLGQPSSDALHRGIERYGGTPELFEAHLDALHTRYEANYRKESKLYHAHPYHLQQPIHALELSNHAYMRNLLAPRWSSIEIG